ncbi:MAG: hypothetical protein LBP62_00375 [Clostridiales bacterium]|jgi:hypothetical protein|nr:hypothetical protein [Clostridiales bacterium]
MPIVKKLFVVKNLSGGAEGVLKYGSSGADAELKLEYSVSGGEVLTVGAGNNFREFYLKRGKINLFHILPFENVDGLCALITEDGKPKAYASGGGRFDFERVFQRLKKGRGGADRAFAGGGTEARKYDRNNINYDGIEARKSEIKNINYDGIDSRKGDGNDVKFGGIKTQKYEGKSVSYDGIDSRKYRESDINFGDTKARKGGENNANFGGIEARKGGENNANFGGIEARKGEENNANFGGIEACEKTDEVRAVKEELRTVIGGAVDELSDEEFNDYLDGKKIEELEKRLRDIIKRKGKGLNKVNEQNESTKSQQTDGGKQSENDGQGESVKQEEAKEQAEEVIERGEANGQREVTAQSEADKEREMKEQAEIIKQGETSGQREVTAQSEADKEREMKEQAEMIMQGETVKESGVRMQGEAEEQEKMRMQGETGKENEMPEQKETEKNERERFFEGILDAAETGFTKKSGGFYEGIKKHLDGMLSLYPAETGLNKLIRGGKFSRIDYGGGYYVVGLYERNGSPEYICYGIPGEFKTKPTGRLKEIGRWFPLDFANKEGEGYWLIFQSPKDGSIVRK